MEQATPNQLRNEWLKQIKAMDNKALKPQAKHVALVLNSYFNSKTGQCNPSNRTMARDWGHKPDYYSKWTRYLEAEGFLTIVVVEKGHKQLHSYLLKPSRLVGRPEEEAEGQPDTNRPDWWDEDDQTVPFCEVNRPDLGDETKLKTKTKNKPKQKGMESDMIDPNTLDKCNICHKYNTSSPEVPASMKCNCNPDGKTSPADFGLLEDDLYG